MHSSTPDSRSVSPEAVETIQIFVKVFAGDSEPSMNPPSPSLLICPAITMTVPQNLSIHNLTTLLSIQTSRPEADLRLLYAGKHLSSSPSSTLEDNHIQRESTINLVLRIRGGMPSKKIRCTHKECKEAAQRIVGDCGFCNGHFCGKHRLLEDHKCTGLEDVSIPFSGIQWWLIGLDDEILADMMPDGQCKKESHDRNAAQLNSERTTVIRGI